MSKFFINRPIVAMVISIVMVILGIVCILSLPIAQFPNIADPLVQVKGTYPGADATTVAQSVATPIEQQMSGVDNMNYMYSTSANNGAMTLTIDFNVKTDPNTDLILSQLRQAQSASQMPAAVTQQGVTVEKSNSSPLMLFALYSPTGQYDAKFITNYAYINLNYQLTRVPGIASVTIYGAGQYAMRIWVDPNKLASLGITVTDVVNALQTQNNVNPAGQIGGEPVPSGQVYTYAVRTQGYLTSPEQFGNIVVRANPDGSMVRVRDVARVELGTQYYNITGRFQGKPSAIIALYQLPDTNALQAANGAKKLMEEAKKNFPPGMAYEISLDTTKAVTAGMEEIVKTLFEALASGRHRRLCLPAGLARDPDPTAGGAGFARGDVCDLPVVRIFHQHAFALRSRCWRSVWSSMTPSWWWRRWSIAHRTRDVAEGRGVQGHGTGHQPGHRHRPDPDGGVRPDGVHPRHHRSALPAVRVDHRDLRPDFRFQRVDLEPRALRPAAQAQDRKPGALGTFLRAGSTAHLAA